MIKIEFLNDKDEIIVLRVATPEMLEELLSSEDWSIENIEVSLYEQSGTKETNESWP